MKRSGQLQRTPLRRRSSPVRASTLRRISARKRAEDKTYALLRSAFLAEHEWCEVCRVEWREDHNRPVRYAEECHHKRGRGKFYLDPSTYLAVCSEHHHKITTEPEWAYRMGYSVRRNSA